MTEPLKWRCVQIHSSTHALMKQLQQEQGTDSTGSLIPMYKLFNLALLEYQAAHFTKDGAE